jgi:hypothetical protein
MLMGGRFWLTVSDMTKCGRRTPKPLDGAMAVVGFLSSNTRQERIGQILATAEFESKWDLNGYSPHLNMKRRCARAI